MSKPKVSVLMPVYNGERYLQKAIDSIINQTFTDWELIIINDGSVDKSEEITNQYNDIRIKYFKNEQNLGLIQTLNMGIDLCSGEYIARMDADDISMSERLQYQFDFLDNNLDTVMCGTNAWVIDNEDMVTGKILNFTKNEYLKIHLLFSVPFIHPTMMIRREILTSNRYCESYKHVEDYELWLRISKIGKIANINKKLLLYRWHDTNVSVQHSDYQADLKDQIIKESLLDLGLIPSDTELFCHKISFQQYSLGKETYSSFDLYSDVEKWFSKLIDVNSKKKIYNNTSFVAYLWSRWIVLCISQGESMKGLNPRFSSCNPVVLLKLLELVLFLKRK